MPNTNSLWKFSFQFFPTISHEKCRDKLCFMKKVLLVLRRRPPEKRSWGINATLLETNYFHPTIFFKLIFKHWCSLISYWCLFILLNKAAYPDFFNDFESFNLFPLILVVAILTENENRNWQNWKKCFCWNAPTVNITLILWAFFCFWIYLTYNFLK